MSHYLRPSFEYLPYTERRYLEVSNIRKNFRNFRTVTDREGSSASPRFCENKVRIETQLGNRCDAEIVRAVAGAPKQETVCIARSLGSSIKCRLRRAITKGVATQETFDGQTSALKARSRYQRPYLPRM